MNENYPFVSIVIPARNSESIIGRCLESLLKLNHPKEKYEIIIADSNSTDKTAEIAKSHGVAVVPNVGGTVCSGRNAGFKIAKGEIIAFSDSDCVMDKDWIKNSLKYFKDPAIGGVGGPNLAPDDETEFGKAVSFIFNRAIFSAGSINARVLKRRKEVKSIPGCNMIFKREALQKVLPLDERLIEAEDYVMNQKIRKLGYKLFYTPDTVVWHYRRPSPKQLFKQMYRYAIGRLRIGKIDRKNINLMHILVGLGLPLLAGLLIGLTIINKTLAALLLLAAFLFLMVYFFIALFQKKSFKTALLSPAVIVIIFCGWSSGFLKELFSPYKNKELVKIYENTNH